VCGRTNGLAGGALRMGADSELDLEAFLFGHRARFAGE